MRTDSIAPKFATYAREGLTRLGQNVQKNNSLTSKLNRFTEGRGLNPGRGAFLALIYSCTLIPRFKQARDDDEKREIIRRDVTTITTICFAMKAIKAGACKLMAKKSGLPLTFTNLPEDANIIRKFLGYFQQKGTTAFSAEDITANYANIDGKESLTRFLKFVDKNDGNVGKVLTFDKAKPNSLFKKKRTDGELFKASKMLLGNNFDFSKSNEEIIKAVQLQNADSEGFAAISKVLKDTKANPVSRFAQGIGSKFETGALFAVAGFLGFGLPKLNEKMTKDKYFGSDGALKTSYENPNSGVPTRNFYNSLDQRQRMVFQNFLGAYQNKQN